MNLGDNFYNGFNGEELRVEGDLFNDESVLLILDKDGKKLSKKDSKSYKSYKFVFWKDISRLQEIFLSERRIGPGNGIQIIDNLALLSKGQKIAQECFLTMERYRELYFIRLLGIKSLSNYVKSRDTFSERWNIFRKKHGDEIMKWKCDTNLLETLHTELNIISKRSTELVNSLISVEDSVYPNLQKLQPFEVIEKIFNFKFPHLKSDDFKKRKNLNFQNFVIIENLSELEEEELEGENEAIKEEEEEEENEEIGEMKIGFYRDEECMNFVRKKFLEIFEVFNHFNSSNDSELTFLEEELNSKDSDWVGFDNFQKYYFDIANLKDGHRIQNIKSKFQKCYEIYENFKYMVNEKEKKIGRILFSTLEEIMSYSTISRKFLSVGNNKKSCSKKIRKDSFSSNSIDLLEDLILNVFKVNRLFYFIKMNELYFKELEYQNQKKLFIEELENNLRILKNQDKLRKKDFENIFEIQKEHDLFMRTVVLDMTKQSELKDDGKLIIKEIHKFLKQQDPLENSEDFRNNDNDNDDEEEVETPSSSFLSSSSISDLALSL